VLKKVLEVHDDRFNGEHLQSVRNAGLVPLPFHIKDEILLFPRVAVEHKNHNKMINYYYAKECKSQKINTNLINFSMNAKSILECDSIHSKVDG